MLNKIKSVLSKINYTACLLSLSLLNILDAAFTIFWVDYGLAEEANPIMKKALELGNIEFLSIKILIVTACCLILYKFKNMFLSKTTILFGLACYIFLLSYHIAAYIHFSSVL